MSNVLIDRVSVETMAIFSIHSPVLPLPVILVTALRDGGDREITTGDHHPQEDAE